MMHVLDKSAMLVRILTVALLALPSVALDAQSSIPSLLLVTKEKVRAGKMFAYDTNETRIAATCARTRCPHGYVALRSTTAPDEVWWLNEYVSAAEKTAVDAKWQDHPSMKLLKPLGVRKDSLRQVLKTTLLRRIAEASPGPPWSIAGTRFLVVAEGGDVTGFSGSVFEAADGRPILIAAAADLVEAQTRAAPYGQRVSVLAVERRWSFPAPEWITADSVFWRPSPAPP
jgi:hypothetical protein